MARQTVPMVNTVTHGGTPMVDESVRDTVYKPVIFNVLISHLFFRQQLYRQHVLEKETTDQEFSGLLTTAAKTLVKTRRQPTLNYEDTCE